MGPYSTAKLMLDSNGSPVIMSGPDQDEDISLASVKRDPVTGGMETSVGGTVINGTLVSGAWAVPPSIFRLLLNGTGTVTIDSRNAAGAITTGVYSTALSGAVNQIEFPYAGDSAISIRATLTGTATVKVV